MKPIIMWAVVVTNSHGSRWIDHSSIRRLRRESRAAYLSSWRPEYHERVKVELV